MNAVSSIVPEAASGISPQLVGWLGLLIVAMIAILIGYRYPRLGFVLAVAFFVRVGAALFHFYVAPLPDGTADAVMFERQAWDWAQGGLWLALGHYPGNDSHFYAWLMSLIYSVTGRSLLLLQSLSVLVGVLGVVTIWNLAREIWEEKTASKAAWVMALFPMVVMYSALTMREAWFVLFLLLGLIGAARWARTGGKKPVVLATTGCVVASFFHGGAFIVLLVFLGCIGLEAGHRWLVNLARGERSLFAGIVVVGIVGMFVLYVASGISIHKLGTAGEMFSLDRWMHYFETRLHGSAHYPEWAQPGNAADFVWAVPLRAVYLLFSPFPWDLREPAHLIGLVDGLFYLTMVVLIWRGRREVWASPGARMLLLILVPLVFAFGVGTGNFGTGLRHRAKLVALLIVLAAPRLPRLVFWYKASHARLIGRNTGGARN